MRLMGRAYLVQEADDKKPFHWFFLKVLPGFTSTWNIANSEPHSPFNFLHGS